MVGRLIRDIALWLFLCLCSLWSNAQFSTAEPVGPLFVTPVAAATADLDGDSLLDFVAGYASGTKLAVYLAAEKWLIPVTIEDSINSTAQVFTADFDNDGDQDVMCRASSTNAYLNTGDGQLFVRQEILSSGNSGATFVTVGDLDNDLYPDIIACRGLSSVMVWIEHQAGSFVIVDTLFALPSGARWLHVTDTDNDGVVDVWARTNDPQRLFHATDTLGDGIPDSASLCLSGFQKYTTLTMADLNGDQLHDLIIVRDTFQRPDLCYTAIAGGCFQLQPDTLQQEGIVGKPVWFGDLEEDGDVDYWLMKGSTVYSQFLRNDGAGAFPQNIVTPIYSMDPEVVLMQDLDDDGFDDILFCDRQPDYVGYFLRRDSLFEELPEPHMINPFAFGEPTFDIEWLDASMGSSIAIGSTRDERLSLMTTRSDRTFRLDTVLTDEHGSYEDIDFADLDGALKPDLALTVQDYDPPYCESYFLLNGDSVFHSQTLDSLSYAASETESVMLEVGGPEGLGLFSSFDARFFQRFGSQWTLIDSLTIPQAHHQRLVADLDGDGDSDLLLASHLFSNSLPIYRFNNIGPPNYFEPAPDIDTLIQQEALGFEFFDGNGDGAADVFLLTSSAAILYVNDGTGGFEQPAELWDRDYVYSVDAGDLNMDGRTDIAFLSHPPAEHRIWWAEQPAAFGDPWDISLIETLDDENFGGDPWKVKLADLDRDGMVDVLHNVNDRVYVHWNEMHVGVSEAMAIQPELMIYPNPCGDLCAVKAMDRSEVVVSVRLRSVEGMVQEFSACPTADGYLLDVSRLAAGCYMIDAILDSGKRTVARVLIIR